MSRLLFHGSRNGSIKKLRPSTGGEFGPGIYLTANRGTAEFYAIRVANGPDGPWIYKVRAELKNPFRVTKTDWIKMTLRSTPRTVRNRLEKKGFDSIIGVALNGYDEQIVAFYPEQVSILGGEPWL